MGYILHLLGFYHVVLHSPELRHSWWSMGLATTIAILILKSYLELYQGKLKKQSVNYENFRQTTHVALGLFILVSICFHMALWPVYGSTTFLVAFLVGFGVVLQWMLLFPTTVQNVMGMAGMMFYLQQYTT